MTSRVSLGPAPDNEGSWVGIGPMGAEIANVEKADRCAWNLRGSSKRLSAVIRAIER
jgi:hypothetical protein